MFQSERSDQIVHFPLKFSGNNMIKQHIIRIICDECECECVCFFSGKIMDSFGTRSNSTHVLNHIFIKSFAQEKEIPCMMCTDAADSLPHTYIYISNEHILNK